MLAGVFFMCWTPYMSVNLWSLHKGHRLNIYVYVITETLTFASLALNPCLYMQLFEPFRTSLKRQWRKLKMSCAEQITMPANSSFQEASHVSKQEISTVL